MRAAAVILILVLFGCGKGPSRAPDSVGLLISEACSQTKGPSRAPDSVGLLISEACSQTDEDAFTFQYLGIGSSKIYSCDVQDKMTCTYAQSADGSAMEMDCAGDYTNPQGVPAECVADPIGAGNIHYFSTTGAILTADRYDCGTIGPMRCDYYVHAADAGCDDYDGPTGNDCALHHDNRILEEFVCLRTDLARFLKVGP